LLLTSDWIMVKILDMGLAIGQAQRTKVAGGNTAPAGVMGTPDYMAPEQTIDARDVDNRADIYSLGCTLYFLLAGRPPFPRGTIAEKLHSHRQEQPPPLEDQGPEVPAEIAQVVRTMMAKSPDDRFQTPSEVADALAPFCEEEAVMADVQVMRGLVGERKKRS
jgi:serine/threonine protein kinase